MAKNEEDPEVLRLVVGFLRMFADLTQTQFADASGLQQVDISHYESAVTGPGKRTYSGWRPRRECPGAWWGICAGSSAPCSPPSASGRPAAEVGAARAAPRLSRTRWSGRSWSPRWSLLHPTAPTKKPQRRRRNSARHCPKELFLEAGQTWEALKRFPVGRRRQVALLLPAPCLTWAFAVRACKRASERRPTRRRRLWSWQRSPST